MMTETFEEEKKKLELKKMKLKQVEKLLKEREKKQRARMFEEIGKIAFKANIDQMDKVILLGAFLEINERKNSPEIVKIWKKNAEGFSQIEETVSKEPLSISFESEPPKEIKVKLKGMDFKWNSFRREFYGYGVKREMEKILAGTSFEIEITT